MPHVGSVVLSLCVATNSAWARGGTYESPRQSGTATNDERPNRHWLGGFKDEQWEAGAIPLLRVVCSTTADACPRYTVHVVDGVSDLMVDSAPRQQDKDDDQTLMFDAFTTEGMCEQWESVKVLGPLRHGSNRAWGHTTDVFSFACHVLHLFVILFSLSLLSGCCSVQNKQWATTGTTMGGAVSRYQMMNRSNSHLFCPTPTLKSPNRLCDACSSPPTLCTGETVARIPLSAACCRRLQRDRHQACPCPTPPPRSSSFHFQLPLLRRDEKKRTQLDTLCIIGCSSLLAKAQTAVPDIQNPAAPPQSPPLWSSQPGLLVLYGVERVLALLTIPSPPDPAVSCTPTLA
ncbi:hypothetical protein CC80DRAFT_585475 [Byssothecium circinans]|uniref:Uncharacterized protein n=1 Tax=Byssothecium circinans TaxID=147558 RepID=A0A6A5U8F7_9PLEO|nr:hypothetical protein CC80DRAFT_585475 [Byssothecium circinans]